MFCAIVTFAQLFQPNWASLNTRKMPKWFQEDKFGIFIHWGLYSVTTYAPVILNSGYSYAEWYWRRIRRDYTEGAEENERSRQLMKVKPNVKSSKCPKRILFEWQVKKWSYLNNH